MTPRHYIMIGAPITNVRSPALLEAYLAECDYPARVEARHLNPADLPGFMADVAGDPAVHGLLVTMPHKKAILPHLQAISSLATKIGSINTVKRLPSGDLVGAQFDGPALVNALWAKGAPLATARILLKGIGGAGLAIAQALVGHGCAHLAIADLDPDLLAKAIRILDSDSAAPAQAGEKYDILINATPMGMTPGDPSPFAPDQVAAAACVADIVADPALTRLADQARAAGITFVSGRDMVIGQITLIGDWLRAPGTEQP